jgi:hypothetical protein
LDDLLWYLQQNPHVVLTTVSEYQRARVMSARVTNRCEVIHNGVDYAAHARAARLIAEMAMDAGSSLTKTF